ncbi:MAG: hypothetical protein ACR2QW_17625 [bacterium]
MSIKKVSLLVVCSFLTIASSGCAVTWNLNEELDGSAEALSLEDSTLIELGPSTGDFRERNRIVHIKHRDLGIEKGTWWFRDSIWPYPKRIFSPPGNLRLRTKAHYYMKPQVEFLAEPGGHYLLSSVCVSTRFVQIPLGFIVIVDANSHQILAVDDFCPDCETLIGAPLSQWQCGNQDAVNLKKMPVEEFKCKCTRQLGHSRLICDAAERGIASARVALAWIYEVPNPTMSYYWYRMAEQLEGDDAFIEDARYLVKRVKDRLTESKIAEIEAMVQKHKRGTCENQLFKLHDCCWLHDCE